MAMKRSWPTLAMVIWHLYATSVHPEVFLLNRAMTRGTLT
jgi:hypothetical protein